ncbi:MAG: LLM class flavin-dependent oxidoreductase [Brotaphodocola sp.]
MSHDTISIRNEIKAEIAKSGWTLTDIVREMNKLHPDEQTTSQNISNKLTRGTLKYSEAREIASIIGRKIKWVATTDAEQ